MENLAPTVLNHNGTQTEHLAIRTVLRVKHALSDGIENLADILRLAGTT